MTKQPSRTLYIVATPIGNLGDLSDRAKEVFASVDTILCEDTRVTAKLLRAFGIDTATTSVHQHTNEGAIRSALLAVPGDVAYVSDAGTPGISDPGGKVVELALALELSIVPIPGPSAVTAALSICGFPTDRFTFFGFPPQKRGRTAFFELVANTAHTVALYESKHRIQKTLKALPQDRQLIVARELTKMHETIERGTAQQVLEALESGSTKGEFVIVLAPTNWK